MPAFTGFPNKTLLFLEELRANNNREWFEENKSRYEALVREPALDLITAMGPHLEKLSVQFVAAPKKVGGSLMRVYNDTRFSRDKTPYKTNIGIQFRHALGKDVHAPGYYLHIDPGECFVGVGLWHPEAEPLAAIRQRIADQPAAWKKVRHQAAFAEQFQLGGESLRRPPKGYDETTPCIDDIKRKDFIASCELSATDIHAKNFVDLVATRFRTATPFMRFLCEAVGVPF
jgi:uncharacterized protein (TIGR02453 family)